VHSSQFVMLKPMVSWEYKPCYDLGLQRRGGPGGKLGQRVGDFIFRECCQHNL
jgi:hypothetical protein